MSLRNTFCYVVLYGALYIVHQCKASTDVASDMKLCIGKHFMTDPAYRILMKIEDHPFSLLKCQNCAKEPQSIILENIGCTIFINFTYADTKQIPTITNGPLEGMGTFRFSHAYFHWLEDSPEDWKYNDIDFAADIHLAFFNIKYETYKQAMKRDNQVAILSAGFRVRPLGVKKEFELLTVGLKDLLNAYSLTKIQPFSLEGLIPDIVTDYFTYSGYAESVACSGSCNTTITWIEFEETLRISPEQVKRFADLRKIYGVDSIRQTEFYKRSNGVVLRSMPYAIASKDSNTRQKLSLKVGILMWMLALVVA